MCMHGFGRFIGNLLAAWFTSLPEAMNAAGKGRVINNVSRHRRSGNPFLEGLWVLPASLEIPG